MQFCKFNSRKISASLTIVSGPFSHPLSQLWGILQFLFFSPAPSFCFPFHGFSNRLGCPRVSLTGLDRPPWDAEGCLLIRAWCLVYSLSSAQGWRFCRAYREELWAHSGSDTADSLRDFWRADCCSCRMRRLACWRSASLSSAVCLLKQTRKKKIYIGKWVNNVKFSVWNKNLNL